MGEAGKKLYTQEDLQSIESLLTSGRSKEARLAFLKLKLSRVPQHLVCDFSALSRRLNCPNRGIRLLQPVVNQHRGGLHLAKSRELAEYGELLTCVGGWHEARKIFGEVDPSSFPDILLFKAYQEMTRWNYTKSSEHLEAYLNHDLAPYSKLRGQLNLGISYGATANEMAFPILEGVLKATENSEHLLVNSSAKANLGAFLVLKGDIRLGSRMIQDSLDAMAGSHLRYLLFGERWLAYARALEGQTSAIEEVRRTGEKSKELELFESYRDSFLMLAKIQKRPELARDLYMGTPFKAYRQRILDWTGIDEPRDFLKNSGGEFQLDLRQGLVNGELEIEPLIRDFLRVLVSDCYKPKRVGEIFGDLYKNEYYDPVHSPNRVSQLIFRTRSFLKQSDLPFSLKSEGGRLQLNLSEAVEVRSLNSLESASIVDRDTDRLFEEYGYGEFKSREAAEAVGRPFRTLIRKLNKLVDSGQLLKRQAGRDVLYKFVNVSSEEAV